MTFDFTQYKEHSLTRPRDAAWGNFRSWKDAKVGDKVQGYIADAFYRPEDKDAKGNVTFREQRGITLKQEDGTLVNITVKYLPFILAATDDLRVGDPLVVELTKILPAKSKGQQGAKVFTYFGTKLPENEGNKTVKQLTLEDKAAGGSVKEEGPVNEEEQTQADEDFGV